MVTFLLKKSYRLKDLQEIDFKDLWGDHGIFTTMWIFGKPPKILFFKNIARKSGTKIKIITEPKTVSNGISILLNPKRIFDNNGKAKINIRSLIATCIKANKGSPFARLLQTKTIAVHGAIPNRIIPETYSLAKSTW